MSVERNNRKNGDEEEDEDAYREIIARMGMS